jgi:ubiquinone/menaquinone biosynthesis C-methylase UbiE
MEPRTVPSETEHEHRVVEAYRRRAAEIPVNRYSLSNAGNLMIAQQRERRLLRLLSRFGHSDLRDRRLLEVGCGTGYWLRQFIQWGVQPANAFGIDLLPDRIAAAKETLPAATMLVCGSAAKLPWPDAHFDLVLQSTALSSVLEDSIRAQIASEMLRVVRPSGLILWYDFRYNNPSNRDAKGLSRRLIHGLFPETDVHLESITLIPQIARRLAPLSLPAAALLGSFPFARTHYIGVIRHQRPRIRWFSGKDVGSMPRHTVHNK